MIGSTRISPVRDRHGIRQKASETPVSASKPATVDRAVLLLLRPMVLDQCSLEDIRWAVGSLSEIGQAKLAERGVEDQMFLCQAAAARRCRVNQDSRRLSSVIDRLSRSLVSNSAGTRSDQANLAYQRPLNVDMVIGPVPKVSERKSGDLQRCRRKDVYISSLETSDEK